MHDVTFRNKLQGTNENVKSQLSSLFDDEMVRVHLIVAKLKRDVMFS